MSVTGATLTRGEIRQVFLRHHGAMAELAMDLRIAGPTVSLWMAGKCNSQRIAEAAVIRALDLLEAERQLQIKEETVRNRFNRLKRAI